MIRRPRLNPLACALLLSLPLPAFAVDPVEPIDTPPTAQDSQDRHGHETEFKAVEIQGLVLPTTADEMTRPVEVLSGERLDEAKAATLGETVGKLPGVQSSYFGPGVGRPIVRGFDGARVQVLSDGLGSGDVSTVSADHAVSIEPFLADQIEVLKGPATLLYGSGAIGGAVNVVDGRTPEALTDEPLQGRAELHAGTVNDERTGMVRVDGSTDTFALHADALHRETGDVDTPVGTLGNTAIRTDSAALGGSWIGERGFVGASASLYSTMYGIPGTEDEGGVRVDMDQRRTEVRAGADDIGPFASARLKLARTEYEHVELEGSEVGTRFDNTSNEGRLEFVHAPVGGWNGAFGLQWGNRDFSAVGEEAFVPSTRSRDAGLFYIGNRDFGDAWRLELGARGDRNEIDADAATAIGPDRTFDTASFSAGLRFNATEDLHFDLGLDRAQRAPTAEELYSNGTHVATQSVELGQPNLDAETANRAELGVHWHAGPIELAASIYHVRYDDFIYLLDTGALGEEDLPIRQWSQADARFKGAEGELTWHVADNATGAWDWRFYGDLVRASLAGGGDLPRIAPARFGSELRWELGGWRASLGALRVDAQDRVAAFETTTPGYTLVDAHIAWHLDTKHENAWEIFLDGSNLLDEEARAHTSFLKDVAPLPGRGVNFGVRTFF
ncbi:TonB-dependent receptor [Lysobacter sp. A6]|uniref:TonB-dependent receptor n=1 Tax=Noviluteimonas lactosilytica TaxID=2888523 RepID=A0ABS8JF97_9GAMM|nr:TonB-dependent receptor [Lysobacter lactosilyticus]MCC8362266.1 TonB-dependent receptor [Lysobacter lactosilyticus]